MQVNGLPRSPPLTDVVNSWPTSLALLFVVVSNGIAGANVLSECMVGVCGAITHEISGLDAVFIRGIVSLGGPS